MGKTVDDIVCVQSLLSYAEDNANDGDYLEARWAAIEGRRILDTLDVYKTGGSRWERRCRDRFDRLTDVALSPYGRSLN